MPITNTERELMRLVRETQFGSIHNVRVSGGLPVIDANTQVSIEYKLSGLDNKREVLSDQDYARKPQVRTLFERLRAMGSGSVECIEVRDGLPFKMTIKRRALI